MWVSLVVSGIIPDLHHTHSGALVIRGYTVYVPLTTKKKYHLPSIMRNYIPSECMIDL